MKTLWFKQIYMTPILSGEKTDTIRRRSCKLRAGNVVAFTVGPRPPFARAEILTREDIDLVDLAESRAAQVITLYDNREPLCRLTFRLL